ncbi:DODA-type extradiol aromatic ring-opening family dioxygenase [Vreelandella sp. EE27]
MGKIVGAAIVSHHPGLFRPKEIRVEMGDGRDSDLLEGYERVRAKLDATAPDTLVIIDSHWFTTARHIVAGGNHYKGIYTSSEMPWILKDMPYDYAGAPALAAELGKVAEEKGLPFYNADEKSDTPRIEPEYPTVNLLEPLWRGERVLRLGICQNAKPHHFLEMGAALGEAVRRSDSNVVILASGALSHRMTDLDFKPRNPRFWHSDNMSDPRHVELDHEIMATWERGDHATVIDRYPDMRAASYEGLGGHYLQLVGALGGRECQAPGKALSEYESALGTANVHIWFDLGEE